MLMKQLCFHRGRMIMVDDVTENGDVSAKLVDAILEEPVRKREKLAAPIPIPIPKPVGKETLDLLRQGKADPQASDKLEDDQEKLESKKARKETPVEDTGEPTLEDLDAPEEEISDEDDDTDPEFEIQVDGETVKVPLSKLKESFSGEGAIEKRLQQTTEAREQAKHTAVQLFDANNETLERLKQLDGHLQGFAEPQVNWEWLRQNDPNQYLQLRDNQRIAQEQRQQLQAEQAEVQKRQDYLSQKTMEMYINEQAEALGKALPELADEEKSKKFMSRVGKAVTHFGYTTEELKEVVDHRVFVVLDYASRYLELVQKKAGQTTKPAMPSATMKTASTRAPVNSSAKKQQAIISKAKATGDPDDVAATLLFTPKRARG